MEELLGARLSHCIGGLTTDPVKRAGWVFALDAIHDHDCLGSMFYGDTLSYTRDFPRNWAVAAEYLLWDILAQLECPDRARGPPPAHYRGHPHSFRGGNRGIQTFGRQVEKTARRLPIWPGDPGAWLTCPQHGSLPG